MNNKKPELENATRLHVKLSDDDLKILDDYCEKKSVTRSDAIRTAIRNLKKVK